MTTQTEIIGLLSQRAMDLGELIVECCLKRNGPIPDMVIYYLQDLVRAGDVRVTKVDRDGRIVRRGKSTDYDRLLWSIPGKDIQLQPAAVTQPAAASKRHSRRTNLDPHSRDKPEPIEILARMAGRSNFITPRTVATNVVPVTPLDIAHAIATAPDKLGAAMAMAMACQRKVEWARIEDLGYPRVLTHLQAQHHYSGIVDAPYTFRARIALYDAFNDLVTPMQRRSLNQAAKDARLRRNRYRYLLHETCAVLEEAANTSARDAVKYLFALAAAEHQQERGGAVQSVSVTSDGDIRIWASESSIQVMEENPDELAVDAVDLNDICGALMHRQPRSGILTLAA